jgi:adenine-specific DNA-methyltransferase
MDKMKQETADLTQENIARIGELFPNVITEMKDENGKLKKGINFDLLKQLLSGDVVDGEESYDFTWVGKKASIVEANTPIRKTLRPYIEESKDWETTENLYIEGDNLDVLKLLQESYLNSVKMIYIDPPYNTGKDFIYKDRFIMDKEEYEEQLGMYDEVGNRLFQNTETNGRFHSDWCSMMYPRLKLARSLLTENGVIFISIDDNEIHNLRKMCDEIFGVEQFACLFPRVTKKAGKSSENIAKNHDYVIGYKKTSYASFFPLEHDDEGFRFIDTNYSERGKYKLNQTLDYDTLGYIESLDYPIEIDGETFHAGGVTKQEFETRKKTKPKEGYRWRWSRELFEFGYRNDFVVLKRSKNKLPRIYTKTYQKATISKDKSGKYFIEYKDRTKPMSTLEFTENQYSNDNAKKDLSDIFHENVFEYSKPVDLLKTLVRFSTQEQDLILDFFSGSATTAHAVMQLNAEDGGNRKFIMVQLPEPCDEKSEAFKAGYKNICEIGKERIRRAGDQINEEIEEGNRQLKLGEEPKKPVDIGFRVLKVDTTNMKDIYYAASEYTQNLLTDQISNIKEDRTDLDLLYGVLLEWGLPLSLKHEIEEIDGVKIHIVDNDSLIACFSENISETVVRGIAKRQPLRAVFRDSSFASSSDKINVEEIFKLLAPNTSVKVI